MADFPRTIKPARVSTFNLPGPLLSIGQGGKIQRRTTAEKGRWWTEEYAALQMSNDDVIELLALINYYWLTGISFTIGHLDYATARGAGGGTPLIDGAAQTGDEIDTDGWPNNTTVLKAGDIVLYPGVEFAIDVRENVVSDGSGNATIKGNPPIESGGSPTDGQAVTYDDVKMTCIIAEEPGIPTSDPNAIITGLRIMFREDL